MTTVLEPTPLVAETLLLDVDDEHDDDENVEAYFDLPTSEVEPREGDTSKLSSPMGGRRRSSVSTSAVEGFRRISRSSFRWFQKETEQHFSQPPTHQAEVAQLIGSDGQLRDDYILKRQSVNRPATLKRIPLLADLAEDFTSIDGWVFSQLLLSGYAKMASKVDELNRINVFPIADGDTGANLKVCLKLATRNLFLDPSDDLVVASSNFAADVLLNGQGNSGTILSHFFVGLAEEIKAQCELHHQPSLSIHDFSGCLVRAGAKMDDAVPQPVEGTLLSLARNSCVRLQGSSDSGDQTRTYETLKELLEQWNTLAQTDVLDTPNQLIVNGVKVLEKAGVKVDSGAQGFAYLVQGMWLASQGQLPEAHDPLLFETARIAEEEGPLLEMGDHTVCDTGFRFCTEGVVLLKDGVTKQDVLEAVTDAAAHTGLGDSIACVGAPAKGGGAMAKVHIHSNEPSRVFDLLGGFSREPILKKEKVEDMMAMREHAHGDQALDLSDAKFSIMGLCSVLLPPGDRSDDLFTLPVFMVPSTTQERIDIRYSTDADACLALNMQRHASTRIRYTTAAPNPMVLKIELLAALSRGKPVLVFLMSRDKRISAIGRNVAAAIDMLSPDQRERVRVLSHGWGFYECSILREAIQCAERGMTIDEAYDACQVVVEQNFCFVNMVSSTTVQKLVAWRPGLFPENFSVTDGHYAAFGLPPVVRDGPPLTEAERASRIYELQGTAPSLEELEDLQVLRIRDSLPPGHHITSLVVPCVGRPDFGHRFVAKLRAAQVRMSAQPSSQLLQTLFLTPLTHFGSFDFRSQSRATPSSSIWDSLPLRPPAGEKFKRISRLFRIRRRKITIERSYDIVASCALHQVSSVYEVRKKQCSKKKVVLLVAS